MHQYYFISGLPRSGSTLLSAILNQNPKFHADISSPLEPITGTSINIITDSENNLAISTDQRKNLIYGTFDGFYRDYDEKIIFDTNRRWTRKTSFLKELFPYTKILCPVRDISFILNSFEKIFSKNPFYKKTIVDNPINVFSRCSDLMEQKTGIIGEAWNCLYEGFCLNPEMIFFVEYEKICKFPDDTMRKIYKFLDEPYFSHDFNNLNFSSEKFDSLCNLKDLHTVRKKVEYKSQKICIPPDVIDHYKSEKLEFWKRIK